MNQVYVGVDLGSSAFQQVAMKTDGSVKVNRDFRTSAAKSKKQKRSIVGVQVNGDWLLAVTRLNTPRHPAMLNVPSEVNRLWRPGEISA